MFSASRYGESKVKVQQPYDDIIIMRVTCRTQRTEEAEATWSLDDNIIP